MDNETLFFIAGISLAASAVLFTVAALRIEKFPGRAAPIVALWFIVLVVCTATFAVLHAQDEKKEEETSLSEASEEAEAEEAEAGDEGGTAVQGTGKPTGEAKPKSPGGTLKLAADPTAIAFDTTSLESKPGKVTIDFSNPSSLEHDVAIEQNGKEIAVSQTITQGTTSVSTELEPGTYTFLCTIPGHAEAGMEGTLVVK